MFFRIQHNVLIVAVVPLLQARPYLAEVCNTETIYSRQSMKNFEHNRNQEQYICRYRSYNIGYESKHLLSDAALVSCGLKSRFCFTQSFVYIFPPFMIGVNALTIFCFVQNINSYKTYLHGVLAVNIWKLHRHYTKNVNSFHKIPLLQKIKLISWFIS